MTIKHNLKREGGYKHENLNFYIGTIQEQLLTKNNLQVNVFGGSPGTVFASGEGFLNVQDGNLHGVGAYNQSKVEVWGASVFLLLSLCLISLVGINKKSLYPNKAQKAFH